MNKKQLMVTWVMAVLILGMSVGFVLRFNYMKTPIKREAKTDSEKRFAQYKKEFGGKTEIIEQRFSKIEIENQRNLMLVLFLIPFSLGGLLIYILRDKKR